MFQGQQQDNSEGPRSARIDLAVDPLSARRARQMTGEVLTGWGIADEELLHDAQVAISELVTNAIVHGGSTVAVELERAADHIVVAVSDGSAVLPQLREAGHDADRGRGMAIVAALSAEWGVETPASGGKRVWARLRTH